MVFQHFSLFETLTVAENIALGLPASMSRDRAQLDATIREVSQRYGMDIDPRRYVNTLSTGEQQRVEIVRCLIQESTLLILDEPTSVLTPQEVDTLFATLKQLAAEGCSIVFISHKLREVRELCHTATVLRQGKVTGECEPAAVSVDDIARLMVGNDTPLQTRVAAAEPQAPLMHVRNLSYRTKDPFGTALKQIDFTLHAGEIIGIAGVAGNGQDELLRALSGEARTAAQTVVLAGINIGDRMPGQRRKLGLAVVPEERLGRGAVPGLSLMHNTLLTAYHRNMLNGPWIRFGQVRAMAQRICDNFGVRSAGIDSQADSLSGGNLQKFILGREALQEPKVLVASHPTWGVDVGSAVAIHEALVKLRDQGAAVLLISEDLDELYQLCTRIGAICAGRLSPLAPTGEVSIEQLGQWMAGEFGASGNGEGDHAAA
jgi:simple sugar transport system ATP-binding protein